MRASKSIAWIFGISAIAVTMATTPAIAIPNNSDTSGTNTTGQTDLLYGFEALINKPVIAANLKELLNTTTKLVDTSGAIESLTDRVGDDPNSAPISAETKAALLALSRHLQDMERGLWAYGSDLDKAIAASAQGLLQDLDAANKGCQANPSSCGQLRSLVTSTSDFVEKLKAFETLLQTEVQKARIY
jgi:hypothetical protein